MKFSRFSRKAAVATALLITILLSFTSARGDAPTFRWAQRAGGVNREYGSGIAVDPAGNSHVIGKFTSTNVFFGSNTLTNGGLFVAAYDVAGNVVWARQINTTFNLDNPQTILSFGKYGIAADGLGNTYVGGWSFGPGSITFEGVTLTNDFADRPDLFLAKYDASGNLAWARKAGPDGTTNSIRALALAADAAGNCYVTGDYFDAPGMGLTNFAGSLGFYTAKFGADGNLVWARPMAFQAHDLPWWAWAIALDNSGGYFVSGLFYDQTIAFGAVTLTNGGGTDIFTVRYDSAGNLLWAKRSGGASHDYLAGIGVDASGACYVHVQRSSSASVSFDGCVVTNGGNCLAKYDPNGNVLWCRSTSTNADIRRCAADAMGNSYVFGTFTDVATFDGITLTNVGSREPHTEYPPNFVAKLDPDGRVLWAKQFGGGDNEYDWMAKGGMAVDAAGNCSLTGFIRITNAVFDAFTLSPVGDDEDVFVARLDADPPELDFSRDGNSLVLSWPTNQPDFALECANELPPTSGWLQVASPVTVVGIRSFVTNPVTAGNQFYRLRKE